MILAINENHNFVVVGTSWHPNIGIFILFPYSLFFSLMMEMPIKQKMVELALIWFWRTTALNEEDHTLGLETLPSRFKYYWDRRDLANVVVSGSRMLPLSKSALVKTPRLGRNVIFFRLHVYCLRFSTEILPLLLISEVFISSNNNNKNCSHNFILLSFSFYYVDSIILIKIIISQGGTFVSEMFAPISSVK